MSSDDTRRAVLTAASHFGTGNATIQELRAAFHSNLHVLCQDAPLTGDYLALFNALGRWESSTGPRRDDASPRFA